MTLRWLSLLVLSLVGLLITPPLMLVVVWFASNNLTDPCLPRWLAWFNTPDDPAGIQGVYEPQVAWIYAHLGWRVKTWYWLGVRNQLNGLFAWLAPSTTSATRFTGNDPQLYPRTKNPFREGDWITTIELNGRAYYEHTLVRRLAWWPSRCLVRRSGWKLQPLMGAPGKVMFLWQPLRIVTIDSTS